MKTKPIPRGEFNDAQNALMRRGSTEDPCGRCGCRRKHHLPKPTFSYATSGASSGKSHELPTLAPTCCECKLCFCFCVGFVEPFAGQPFAKCVYEPSTDIAQPDRAPGLYPGNTGSSPVVGSVCSRCGSRVIDGICQNYGCEREQVTEPKPAPEAAKKRTKKPNDEQPRLFA